MRHTTDLLADQKEQMQPNEQLLSRPSVLKSTAKKTILLIDDNSDLLNLCKMLLEMNDYEVHGALGGNEAFSILNEIGKPDLILVDLRMEIMSGPEFLIELEKHRPEIIESVPIVFLTAMDKVPVSKAVGFIRKPFENDSFIEAVAGFIESGT